MRRFGWRVWLAVSTGVVLSLLLVLGSMAWNRIELQHEFERETHSHEQLLLGRIQQANAAVASLATLFVAGQYVDADQFRLMAEGISGRLPFVTSALFAPRVRHSDLAAFESEVRDRGYPGFRVQTERKSEVYFPVRYYEPFSPLSARFMGVSLRDQQQFGAMIDKAASSGEIALAVGSGTFGDVTSFWLVSPLYAGRGLMDVSQRELLAKGVVGLAIDMRQLSGDSSRQGVGSRLKIRDANHEHTVVSVDPAQEWGGLQLHASYIVPISDKQLVAEFARPLSLWGLSSPITLVASIVGLFFTLLLIRLAQHAEARNIAEQRLRHSHADLEQQVKARTREVGRQNAMLNCMDQLRSSFIKESDPFVLFPALLDQLLELTNSEFGLVGDVLYDEHGSRYLKCYALSNLAWNKETNDLYQAHRHKGLEFRKLGNLFGLVVTTGKPVVSNDPGADPRGAGFPKGHPPLSSFLGIPVYFGKQLVGEIGLANRPGGYDESLLKDLSPVVDATAQIIVARWESDKRLHAEFELQESHNSFQEVLESTQDGFWIADSTGRILETNSAYCRMSGYSREELIGMQIPDLEAREGENDTARHIETIMGTGYDLFDSEHRRKDGVVFPVEVSVSYSNTQGGRFFAFVRDIQDRKQSEALARLRQQLAELVYRGDRDELMRAALDAAEKETQSQIGFFHFVESDQQTVSLQVWSTRTLTEMCYAKGEGLHYPVNEAGVWVDCIHQNQAVIHNDYESLPHKKGLPEGHAPVVRELVVPVFREDRIVAVMGVGNKAIDYDQQDQELVEQYAELGYDYMRRKESEDRIEHMAFHDTLTGLPNRQLLADRLRQGQSFSRRSGLLLAICYLDLDEFKPVNDRYGHHVGDILLIQLANRLKETLREGDTLARLGGDEFVILLNGLPEIYKGEEIIARILRVIEQPFDIEDKRIYVSASIGATYFPTDDMDADALLRHADQAMYKAKDEGKSKYCLYDPVENQKVHTYRQAIEDFEAAIRGQQLVLYYQPKVDLESGEVMGMEALVRWQHPQQGLLPPASFLELIEGTPQEIMLGEWVLKTAVQQHMAWRAEGVRLSVGVNISPHHMQLAGFVEYLQSLLDQYPDDVAQYLDLEVLETAAIEDMSEVSDIMNACARLGVHFSLDDFGTGYSSLTYFHRLPIDVLKIDQRFVREMLSNPLDLDIVEGVVRLAGALSRPVVAEGVESVEIALVLLQLGCRYAQGYGVARPMPAAEVLPWLEKWEGNNLWRNLRQEIAGEKGPFDLNVSIFSHRRWLQQIVQYLETGDVAGLPTLDERQCHFGRWYDGVGKARYGSHPSYAFIKPKHSAIHRLAAELVTQYQEDPDSVDRQRIDELMGLGEGLIVLLRQLSVAR